MLVHVTTVAETLGFLRGQLRFMQSRGFTVHVVASPGETLNRFATEEGVRAHPILMERRITPLRDLAALLKFVARFRSIAPDIVHASTPKGGLLGTIAARIAGVPLVVYHVRGLPFTGLRGLKRTLLKLTERISCALAHRVICVSESVRKELLAEGISNSRKLRVLAAGSSNGVDAEKRFNPEQYDQKARAALRKEFHLPDGVPVVGFVGRLVRDKGVVELARAWAGIAERYPTAWLLIVGHWEARDAVPEAASISMKNHPRVRMVGERLDVERFYGMMDMVVLPSFREGFPNVPLEAAAMELPSIVTNATGCVDAVLHEETGLIVPPGNAETLAAAISRYLDDEALRHRHGRAGRLRVLRDFRPITVWTALYHEYLAGLIELGRQVPEFEESP